MKKVSIITVSYNSVLTIRRTILSVIDQKYPNVEYIIIDGGSTDGTVEIIKEYSNQITKFISEPDHGISDAFNKGIANASGDYIGIINSDDWYEPDSIKQIVIAFEDSTVGIVAGKIRYWKNGKPSYVFSSNSKKLIYEMTVNHPGVFVRSELYKKHGNFLLNFKYAMDYELMLRFYKNDVRFHDLDIVLSNMSLDGVSDKNWFNGLAETYFAKLIHNTNLFVAIIYFSFQVIRKLLFLSLVNLKLYFVIDFIKKNFSILKKVPTNEDLY